MGSNRAHEAKRLVAPAAALVGALLAWRRGHQLVALGILAGAFVLAQVSLVAPERLVRFDAAMRRGIRAVFRVIAMVVGLLVLAPLWALFRLVRVDPLRPNSSIPGQWRRVDGPVTVDMFSATPSPSGSERWRVRGAFLALFGLAAAAVIVATSSQGSGGEEEVGILYRPFAFTAEPWGEPVMDEYRRTQVVADPETIWQTGDYAGTYHHIADRVRQSWEPEDPTLTVWFLGGSAAWGVGQRDDRTVPSMLARQAAAAGVDLEIVNMAVPGFVSWQETAVLRRELARQSPPDLVIVYHGSNDLGTLMHQAATGMTPLDRPGNLLDAYGVGFVEPAGGPPVDDLDEVADAGLTILEEETRAMEAAAAAAGVPIITVWQPSLWSGAPNRWDGAAIEANALSVEYLDQVHTVEDAIVEALPDDLIDLRTALDDADQPTFFDTVHTNEHGAALVADAMWEQLEPQISALADTT